MFSVKDTALVVPEEAAGRAAAPEAALWLAESAAERSWPARVQVRQERLTSAPLSATNSLQKNKNKTKLKGDYLQKKS